MSTADLVFKDINKETNKVRLEVALGKLADARVGVLRIDKQDNIDPLLAAVWIAQETKRWADVQLAVAWAQAQEAGLVPIDEALRALGHGSHMVCQSATFCVTAEVASPRDVFDKEEFLERAPRRFRVGRKKLLELVNECTKKSLAPLTKRVLETRTRSG